MEEILEEEPAVQDDVQDDLVKNHEQNIVFFKKTQSMHRLFKKKPKSTQRSFSATKMSFPLRVQHGTLKRN